MSSAETPMRQRKQRRTKRKLGRWKERKRKKGDGRLIKPKEVSRYRV